MGEWTKGIYYDKQKSSMVKHSGAILKIIIKKECPHKVKMKITGSAKNEKSIVKNFSKINNAMQHYPATK